MEPSKRIFLRLVVYEHELDSQMRTMTVKTSPPLITSLVKCVAVVLSVAICVVAGLNSSIHVPTFHLDGAFQTASGLFRLDSGQLPGRDFFPYLGVGPLLVIFPIYKIFGGDLAATVAAAKFTTMFLSWIAVATLWLFVFRPANVIDALVASSLTLFGMDFVAKHLLLPNWLAFGLEPHVSLRPVRAVLPYLVALLTYFLIKKMAHVHIRNFLISAVLGAALLWSNDFAIPTFGCFLLFVFFYFYCFEGNCVRNTSIIAATSIAVWFGLLLLVTASHPIELLKYNFLDVAKDQWWYFASSESSAVYRISHISKLLSTAGYFPLLVLSLTLLLALKTRIIETILVFFIGLAIFLGGSIASIGGHLAGHYFGAFYFWAVVASLIFCVKTLALVSNSSKSISLPCSCIAYLSLLLIVVMFAVSLQDYKGNLKHTQSDENKFYVDEFGAFLDVAFLEYINFARQNHDAQAIEDYWGLYSALNKQFPPWPVDSVIHALGSVRETSRQSLIKTDFIITTRYLACPPLQPWSLSQNYWFYDELISEWEPVLTSPTTVVWKRTQQRKAFVETPCHVSADKSSFTLPLAEPGFYRVRLGYSSGGGRHLLMVRNNISFPPGALGFLSLMPGTYTATFPVFLIPVDEEPVDEMSDVFNLKVIGSASAKILSCAADKINYVNDDLLHPRDFNDFYVSDENWINGISRHWAGFFTRNTEKNRAKFRVGSTVVFPNGDKRAVVSVAENGIYLHVSVDGTILNFEEVGFPSKYKVLQ